MNKQNIDQQELKNFERMADDWWNPNGKLKLLHQINPLRLQYIRESAAKILRLDESKPKLFEGKKILDVGCGGGLLSIPLARMGAEVTAIDAVDKNINIAKAQAKKENIDRSCTISFADSTIEMLPTSKQYDVICCLEVIEHVPSPSQLVAECAKRLKPGGMLVLSTMNRTVKSLLLAKIAAEYILRWMPIGTHQWDKFLTPYEIQQFFIDNKLVIDNFHGYQYSLIHKKWFFSKDLSVNYLVSSQKIT